MDAVNLGMRPSEGLFSFSEGSSAPEPWRLPAGGLRSMRVSPSSSSGSSPAKEDISLSFSWTALKKATRALGSASGRPSSGSSPWTALMSLTSSSRRRRTQSGT